MQLIKNDKVMFIFILLLIPLTGLLLVSSGMNYNAKPVSTENIDVSVNTNDIVKTTKNSSMTSINAYIKSIALQTTILTLLVSIFMFSLYDFSSNQFQFVQEYHEISTFNVYLGVDGLSIYFVLLTTIIMPIALLSN